MNIYLFIIIDQFLAYFFIISKKYLNTSNYIKVKILSKCCFSEIFKRNSKYVINIWILNKSDGVRYR